MRQCQQNGGRWRREDNRRARGRAEVEHTASLSATSSSQRSEGRSVRFAIIELLNDCSVELESSRGGDRRPIGQDTARRTLGRWTLGFGSFISIADVH